jgi:hypothetical protein
MLKYIYVFIVALLLNPSFGWAQNSVLDVGARLQKTVNLYNENGVAVNYSNKNLLADRLYFGFSYVTSRLGTAYNSNAIKQDNYLVSAAWYFRRQSIIRPFIRLNTGYFSADYGSKIFDLLPRKSLLFSSDFGLSFETGTPIKITTSLGYNAITGNGGSGPGTLYPVFYQLTLFWSLFNQSGINHPFKNCPL